LPLFFILWPVGQSSSSTLKFRPELGDANKLKICQGTFKAENKDQEEKWEIMLGEANV